MTKQEHINYWVSISEHDIPAAESLFKSGNYDWCLFISHLILEKILKAHFVKDNDDLLPPKIHDLVRLVKLTKLALNEQQLDLLEEINDFYLESRYPEYKKKFYLLATFEYTKEKFENIKEIYKWLKSELTY